MNISWPERLGRWIWTWTGRLGRRSNRLDRVLSVFHVDKLDTGHLSAGTRYGEAGRSTGEVVADQSNVERTSVL